MIFSIYNVGYNQLPHPSFFIGTGMSEPPTPAIYTGEEIVAPEEPGGENPGGDTSDESDLPDTATNTFNWLLASLLLILSGTAIWLFARKRKNREIK
ncbi:hypothetical protein JCM21714_2506 [Gracilibacillus boraciitolerans JCM 21714]|uniref:Gram-positive cocci surface proteins LPxTG domain-containing protein n=1 Tax=Gracilibacillus boraciitolerans JCM 21714 TaxID=1298598 RepID=W4VKZ7_9BACI|nr:LPXTG cell wall anchor domain-containing protein [Gracilibacillus boraciitolerans]GAE93424.1 hypothetical protein JCM21714_2506 [Gracilibacillus boraciitolerans JCM 21714]